MLKTLLLSISCSSLFIACVASHDDIETTEAEAAALEAQPLCPDLYNQEFYVPKSCTKDGKLGVMDCYMTCDIYRSIQFTTSGTTCKTDGSDCSALQCGPCEVPEWQGPLGPVDDPYWP